MAAPKSTCPDCLEPLTDCCCDVEDAPAPGMAAASGLTVLYASAEGADADPGEPDPGLRQIES